MCEKKELSICWIKKLYEPSDILLRAPFQPFIETLQKGKIEQVWIKETCFFPSLNQSNLIYQKKEKKT